MFTPGFAFQVNFRYKATLQHMQKQAAPQLFLRCTAQYIKHQSTRPLGRRRHSRQRKIFEGGCTFSVWINSTEDVLLAYCVAVLILSSTCIIAS